MNKKLRIAIVAGETSGDILGAGLIRELNRQSSTEIQFCGIGGELMSKEGFESDADMEKLSIIGFDGLWENLLDILSIRKALQKKLITNPPDVFIGIDVPDFNLTLEKRLKQKGIPTIHYVSPTVWAWRSYRIIKIRKSVSLMLTLFPFEKKYYQQRHVPVEFVGHPLAKKIAPDFRVEEIDQALLSLKNQHPDKRLIAVLPGSRRSEIDALGELFIDTILKIHQQNKNTLFLIPLANRRVGKLLHDLVEEHSDQHLLSNCLYFFSGHLSADVMRISDVVLLSSGTAALESALLAKPTVVSYKASILTYWFARLTSTVKHASMPNHLLDEPIVPEYLQSEATVENLSTAVMKYLNDDKLYASTSQALATIHPKLDKNSDRRAALAILSFLAEKLQKNTQKKSKVL